MAEQMSYLSLETNKRDAWIPMRSACRNSPPILPKSLFLSKFIGYSGIEIVWFISF